MEMGQSAEWRTPPQHNSKVELGRSRGTLADSGRAPLPGPFRPHLLLRVDSGSFGDFGARGDAAGATGADMRWEGPQPSANSSPDAAPPHAIATPCRSLPRKQQQQQQRQGLPPSSSLSQSQSQSQSASAAASAAEGPWSGDVEALARLEAQLGLGRAPEARGTGGLEDVVMGFGFGDSHRGPARAAKHPGSCAEDPTDHVLESLLAMMDEEERAGHTGHTGANASHDDGAAHLQRALMQSKSDVAAGAGAPRGVLAKNACQRGRTGAQHKQQQRRVGEAGPRPQKQQSEPWGGPPQLPGSSSTGAGGLDLSAQQLHQLLLLHLLGTQGAQHRGSRQTQLEAPAGISTCTAPWGTQTLSTPPSTLHTGAAAASPLRTFSAASSAAGPSERVTLAALSALLTSAPDGRGSRLRQETLTSPWGAPGTPDPRHLLASSGQRGCLPDAGLGLLSLPPPTPSSRAPGGLQGSAGTSLAEGGQLSRHNSSLPVAGAAVPTGLAAAFSTSFGRTMAPGSSANAAVGVGLGPSPVTAWPHVVPGAKGCSPADQWAWASMAMVAPSETPMPSDVTAAPSAAAGSLWEEDAGALPRLEEKMDRRKGMKRMRKRFVDKVVDLEEKIKRFKEQHNDVVQQLGEARNKLSNLEQRNKVLHAMRQNSAPPTGEPAHEEVCRVGDECWILNEVQIVT